MHNKMLERAWSKDCMLLELVLEHAVPLWLDLYFPVSFGSEAQFYVADWNSLLEPGRLHWLGQLLMSQNERWGEDMGSEIERMMFSDILSHISGVHICFADVGEENGSALVGFCVVQDLSQQERTIHLISTFLAEGSGVGRALVQYLQRDQRVITAYDCSPLSDGFWEKMGEDESGVLQSKASTVA